MDEAKFRAAAKAEGYTDEQIDDHLGKAKPASKSFIEEKKVEAENKFTKNKEDNSTLGVPNNLLLPAAVGIGGAALGYAGKGYAQSQKRAEPPVGGFKEPAFDLPPVEQAPMAPQAMQQPQAPQAVDNPNILQEKLAAIQAAQQAPIVEKTPDAAPTIEKIQPIPTMAALDDAGDMKVPEVFKTTSTEPSPAVKKARQKLTFDDTPQTAKQMLKEGTTFMPGYGPGDNHLFNTYGNEGRKDIIKKFNNGKPVGDYNTALELEKQVQGVRFGPAIPPTIRNERGIPRSEFGNFGALGKGLKVGGVAGLGIAASSLANASPKERANAAGEAAMGMMPPALQGLTYSGSAGESAQEMQDLRQRQTVGAGRGIAPPSAYIRIDPKKQWEEMKQAGLVFGTYKGK